MDETIVVNQSIDNDGIISYVMQDMAMEALDATRIVIAEAVTLERIRTN